MPTSSKRRIVWLVKDSAQSPAFSKSLKRVIGARRVVVLRSWDEAIASAEDQQAPEIIFTEIVPRPETILALSRSLPGVKIMGVTAHNETYSVAHASGDLLKFLSRRAEVMKFDRGLTPGEKKVLHLMVKGYIKKEIAERLSLSFHTVNNRERKIYGKLNVHTRPAAVAKALMEGLV